MCLYGLEEKLLLAIVETVAGQLFVVTFRLAAQHKTDNDNVHLPVCE